MNHITIRRYLNETIYCFYNLFAYANNNPVKYYDPDGRVAVVVIGVRAIIAAVAVLCIAFIVLCYPALRTTMETIRYSIQDFFHTCKGKGLSYWARRKKSQRLHIHRIVAKTD